MSKTSIFLTVLLLNISLAHQAMAADEGIRVHGHWVLTFYKPEGGIDRVVEFDNALQVGGAETLSSILTREEVIGEWQILLADGAGAQHVCGPIGSPAPCHIVEPTNTVSSPTSTNLTVTNLTNSVELNGSVTATNDGAIEAVSTRLVTCASNISPDNCEGVNVTQGSGFTIATIPTEAVSEGQLVEITVTLSFN